MIQPYYSKAAYYGSFFREKDGDINHLGLDAKLNGTAKYQKVNLVDLINLLNSKTKFTQNITLML